MYRKMLVPLDGSELAEKALPYALRLTLRLRLETTLLHVCTPAESPSLFMCRSYIEHVAELARRELQETGKKAQPAEGGSPVVTGEAVAGDVPGSLLEYADRARADLILISRHGQAGKGRWLLGSVAHKVLTASTLPVLIIYPDGHGAPPPEWPRSMLVLLDGSELSETVLPHVGALSGQRTEVTLFQVCEPPDLLSDYPEAIMPLTWDEHVQKAKAASERACSTYLARIRRRLESNGTRVHTEVALGETATGEIVRFLREHPFDLVLMSTHGRSGISEWPYGHVADRIIQSVTIPLFLVRPRPK